jgi:hypothetical protein
MYLTYEVTIGMYRVRPVTTASSYGLPKHTSSYDKAVWWRRVNVTIVLSGVYFAVRQLVSPACNHMENSSERTACRFCCVFPRKLQLVCNCCVHALCQDAMFVLHKQRLLCTWRFTPNMFDVTTLTTVDTNPSNGIVRSWFIFRIMMLYHIAFSCELIIPAYCRKMSDY